MLSLACGKGIDSMISSFLQANGLFPCFYKSEIRDFSLFSKPTAYNDVIIVGFYCNNNNNVTLVFQQRMFCDFTIIYLWTNNTMCFYERVFIVIKNKTSSTPQLNSTTLTTNDQPTHKQNTTNQNKKNILLQPLLILSNTM